MRKPTALVGICLSVIVVVLVAILGGCGSQPIAVVNGIKVTRAEFNKRLEQTQGKQVLGDLILRALVEDAFAKSGLTLTNEELEEEVEKAKSSAPDEAAWQQMLAAQGIDEEELRDYFGFRMKVRKLATKDVKVTEEALKEFFEENKQFFDQPAMVEFSEIVLADKAEAEKLVKQLKASPETFGDLARQHSLSPITRDRGGRRGKVPVERITPVAVRAAIEKMAVGKLIGPLSAEGNWYLIKLDARHQAKQATFEEVKDVVEEQYTVRHAKSEQDLMNELRKSAQVTVIDPKYQSLNEFFRPEPTSLPTFGAGEKSKPDKKPDKDKAVEKKPAKEKPKPDDASKKDKQAEKAYEEPADKQPETQ